MFKKKHVGRPTNEELKKRSYKKIAIASIPLLGILLVVTLIKSGSLSKLMGASVGGNTYQCEQGGTLQGSMCIVTTSARLLGDVNGDSFINENDAEMINGYLSGNNAEEMDKYALAAADVNGDSVVTSDDYSIMINTVNGNNVSTIGSTSSTNIMLDEKYVCPSDTVMEGTDCVYKYQATESVVYDSSVGAKKLGADWIELDVQQTKDKQIVVSHDTNLLRVTGVNKDIIDMDYSEIQKLDAGSFFNKKFKNEKMPLLSEVLEFAKKNNIRLNIELKPTGKEIDFEKQVVDLIKEYNFEEKCVITSQVYDVLKNVKKVDKDIKTVYVMSIAIGNITDAKYADAFSVEASNVNATLINEVHNEGKELYAWTVNKEESINKMIDMNVDNIITDNIELGKELVEKSKSSDLISEFIKSLFYK